MSLAEFMENLFSNKRRMSNLVIALFAGIVLLTLGSGLFQGKPPAKEAEDTGYDVERLERRLENILSQIQGAGSVSVMIVLDDSGEKVVASDSKSSSGNSGSEEKKTVTIDGGKQPLILRTVQPNVKGVIVAAQGAGDPAVKDNIEKAVTAVLPVYPHRVEVFVKK